MSDVAAGRALIPRLSTLARFTFVDVILWCLRIGVTVVVVGGTIGTLIKGTYVAAQWFDLVMFGLTLGSVYALIALGYTMVYGVLRLINFAHGDIMMTGAFSGYFVANTLDYSGFLNSSPILGMGAILAVAVTTSTVIAVLTSASPIGPSGTRAVWRPLSAQSACPSSSSRPSAASSARASTPTPIRSGRQPASTCSA